jgi:hypothetical protein
MPHLATQENHYRFYVIELLVSTPDAISILNAINLPEPSPSDCTLRWKTGILVAGQRWGNKSGAFCQANPLTIGPFQHPNTHNQWLEGIG